MSTIVKNILNWVLLLWLVLLFICLLYGTSDVFLEIIVPPTTGSLFFHYIVKGLSLLIGTIGLLASFRYFRKYPFGLHNYVLSQISGLIGALLLAGILFIPGIVFNKDSLEGMRQMNNEDSLKVVFDDWIDHFVTDSMTLEQIILSSKVKYFIKPLEYPLGVTEATLLSDINNIHTYPDIYYHLQYLNTSKAGFLLLSLGFAALFFAVLSIKIFYQENKKTGFLYLASITILFFICLVLTATDPRIAGVISIETYGKPLADVSLLAKISNLSIVLPDLQTCLTTATIFTKPLLAIVLVTLVIQFAFISRRIHNT